FGCQIHPLQNVINVKLHFLFLKENIIVEYVVTYFVGSKYFFCNSKKKNRCSNFFIKGDKWGYYGNVRVCEFCYNLVKPKISEFKPNLEKNTSLQKLFEESGFNVNLQIQY